jgi:hypothetical protein
MNEEYNTFFSESYNEIIETIYAKHLKTVCTNTDLFDIYGRGGKIYAEIFALNIHFKRWQDPESYDHFLAFCIAGWVKDHIRNKSLTGLTQEQIADSITKLNIDWIEKKR